MMPGLYILFSEVFFPNFLETQGRNGTGLICLDVVVFPKCIDGE
jgi:hypothetical protein